jgi:hypothetical protein
MHPDGREGLDHRIDGDALFVSIPAELPADDICWIERPDGAKRAVLLVTQRIRTTPDRRSIVSSATICSR